MAHFKYQLDQSVNHLERMFPSKRVVTNKSLGFDESTPDEELVAYASEKGHLLITANTKNHDFENAARKLIAQSSKKENGCTRVPGLVLLLSNERIIQERILR